MNRQQLDKQIDYLHRELTHISQELLYLEGAGERSLRVRQARLIAELERVESQRIESPAVLQLFTSIGSATR
ncbi:MAG: hypothetical protein M1434_14750 [Chloroflexi bacterium]|nr:hypothetical protein [Chloroflexota bacterium]MCL5275978.1 hypothetical protein [Chloroflexota bacterium]